MRRQETRSASSRSFLASNFWKQSVFGDSRQCPSAPRAGSTTAIAQLRNEAKSSAGGWLASFQTDSQSASLLPPRQREFLSQLTRRDPPNLIARVAA